ncbi:hypothetical protein E2562_004784 [Oryza meyeriana var. granulata]|uniref:protein-serine/threonine phosphatase n=1 Tax=Oryza meyeriana var. granulata TaxID=110450 RepID=A0A6G1DE88_9ORYZ|nr:hypothetical protein E2562_004784 [Oryza meyeriana var. granulata]
MGALRRWLPCCCCGGGGGGAGKGSVADGLVWDVALKAHASGDYSVAVAQANEALEDQAQVLASPAATLVGVYDGHGGPEAARFVNKRLFSLIQEFKVENGGGLSAEVLEKAFGATEEEFVATVQRSWPSQPRILSVGSCCLVGAIEDGTLYVANLGDSRAVLGRRAAHGKGKNRVVAERLSRDHNVADEDVRRELTEMHPDDSHIVLNTHGVWRIKGIIQVSRSIGDVYLKKPEICKSNPMLQQSICPFPLRRPVMSAVPSIKTRKLRPGDQFVIFASDGLWEQLTDEAAVHIVASSPRKGVAKRLVRAAQLEAARKKDMKYERIRTIEKGQRRHFHDDITVVVLFLDKQRRGKGGERRGHDDEIDGTKGPVDVFSLSPDDQEDPTRPVLR